jgi:hypothetical protein
MARPLRHLTTLSRNLAGGTDENRGETHCPFSLTPDSAGFLLRLFFDPEDGASIFPETSGFLHPSRRYNLEDSSEASQSAIFLLKAKAIPVTGRGGP